MFLKDFKNFDNIALINEDNLFLTYSQLNKKVIEFSNFFECRHLVFIIGENDVETIVSYLSSLDYGMVPLLLSAKIDINQLKNLIKIYKPKYIFQKFGECPYEKYSLESSYLGYALFVNDKKDDINLHPDLALLLTTSGSTGSPKLVRLTKKNLISNARSISSYLGITSKDRAITSLPFNYSYGLSVINSHFISGGSIVLSNSSMIEGNFWHLINNHSVTSLAGVPYNYEMILKLGFDRLKISSIRIMTQAGGKLDADKIHEIYRSANLKKIKFYSMYGQTEATARISYLSPKNILKKKGSIGKVIPDGKLWIEDKYGKLIDQCNKVGELVYSGENVSMGYAESSNDLEKGDINKGILKTGDLAQFDSDGFFYIKGSCNRFLKIFGNRISLDSIEEIIAKKGFECSASGDDNKLLIFVVENNSLSLEVLKAEVSNIISISQTAIQINSVKKLPRMDNGKIDYNSMKFNI